MAAEPERCSVCFDGFNKSTRVKTSCPRCAISICRTCLQTYLLGDISDTPRCINPECTSGWEREYIDGELTRQFRLITYKEHREKVLMDREKSRLPATQEDAAAYKHSQVETVRLSEISGDIQAQISQLERRLYGVQDQMHTHKGIIEHFGAERFRRAGGAAAASSVQKTAAAAFIRACPAEGCKGFLSTAWKCGLCNKWACSQCHEVKGDDRDAEHTCDPNNVATAQLIERESKPCPKCAVRISKIDGCDQMWCVACNTAFSWTSGRIAEGAVHNPHYFDWLRKQGVDPATRPAAAGAGGACGRNDDYAITRALGNGYGYLSRTSENQESRHTTEYLYEAWRQIREIQDPYAYRNRIANADTQEQYRQLRVLYMSGEIPEDEWKIKLQRVEKNANFFAAESQVDDVFVNAGQDLMRQVLTPEHDKKSIKKQFAELVQYCNECYAAVSKRFGRVTRRITIKTQTAAAGAVSR